MGSVSLKIGDGTARFRRATLCSSALHVVMLASVLTTNLFALYAFTAAPSRPARSPAPKNLSILSEHVSLILREIEASESRLHQIQRQLAGYDTLDPTKPSLPPELRLFLARHPLPLGRDARSGITSMVSSVAHTCARSADLLSAFMSYSPAARCPEDPLAARKLASKSCEPLPRRRCLSRLPPRYSPLLPQPRSLWNIAGKPPRGYNGFDEQMWVKSRGKNDFSADDVLSMGKGGIRTGLDIDGGGGNFAARMAERNVTVVTTTMDMGEFVAARGLFPLQMTPVQRLPFYDSVFDLVHTVKGLDEGTVGVGQQVEWTEVMEFLMFDIDRVLRAGGLFWIDNYHCMNDEKKRVVTRLIERFRYKKLKWVVGEREDASGKLQVYLSAVLQKPPRG